MKYFFQNRDIWLRLKKITSFVCFAAILLWIFVHVTYLFRGDLYSRKPVVGIKEEKPLDMVYIGGSAAYCYWEPLKAWNDCGFTSYDMATSRIQAESILYYIKHTLKYQKPSLFVIGVRAFEYYEDEGNETGLRKTSDSLDLGFDRLRLVHKYLENRNMDVDKWSLYLDIMEYHTNYGALASEESWELADNSCEDPYKGCGVRTAYCYLEKPRQFQTENRRELLGGGVAALYELLEFCKEEELNVLFVVCPYMLTRESYERYNTIGDIVSSYGFRFLNANDYYEEMGLDFAEDFSDYNHVNVLGAEKYTEFLENYITENYRLYDHREESNYRSWDESYSQFADMISRGETSVKKSIALAQEGKVIASQLCGTDDLAEWCSLAKDSRFTVFAVGNGATMDAVSHTDRKALEALGLMDLEGENYIRILCDSEVLYTNWGSDEKRYEMQKTIDEQHSISYVIDNTDGSLSVILENEECSRKDKDGINIVVFENDYRYVADSVTIKCGADGNIELIR